MARIASLAGYKSMVKHRWRVFPASILVLLVGIASGLWWFATITVQRRAQRVRTDLREGRFTEASTILEQWLRDQPRAAEAHYLKAELAWAQNDLPLVHDELAKAGALGYPMKSLAGLRGLLLARANQSNEAEPLLRQAVESSKPLDPDIAEALTQIYLKGFRLGRAMDLLNRWIQDWPDDARPYFLRTEIDTRNHVSAETLIADCQEALQRNPCYLQARLRLADLLRLNHQNAEASTQYAAYLEAKPNDPLGHLGKALNALDQGQPLESVYHLDQALSLSPHDSVILEARARVEFQLGRLESAEGYLNQAVKADPFNYSIRYQRMLFLTRQGRKNEAEAERVVMEQIRRDEVEFSEISHQLKTNPLDVELRRRAALWLMKHGHEQEAIDWARLVLESVPSDPSTNRLLADYYRKKGETGLANFHEAHASAASNQAR